MNDERIEVRGYCFPCSCMGNDYIAGYLLLFEGPFEKSKLKVILFGDVKTIQSLKKKLQRQGELNYSKWLFLLF